MKKSLFLLFYLTASAAVAQSTPVSGLDTTTLEIVRKAIFPAVALFMLGYFVLSAIRLVLNYLLKNKIVDTAVISEKVVERLLPGPQDEQNRVVKWVALLLSTGAGLAVCNQYLPLGLHSVVILLFSTAIGFLAYYLFLRRQAQ